MKRSVRSLLIVLGISTPLFASAQGLTREQVHQEMVEYKAAGFNPARQNPRTWVDNAQAASTKVMAARANEAQSRLAEDHDKGAYQSE